MTVRPDVVARVRSCLGEVDGGLTHRERALLLATIYRHRPDGLDPVRELELAAREVRALNRATTRLSVHGLGRLLAAVDVIVHPDPHPPSPNLDTPERGGRHYRADVDG